MEDRRRALPGVLLSLLAACGEVPDSPAREVTIGVKESAICQAEHDRTTQECATSIWPGGKVYYGYDDTVQRNSATFNTVEAAMRRWEEVSHHRLTFIEDKNQQSRLHIKQTPAGEPNRCPFGPSASGPTTCFLSADPWTAAHELGHGLGLWHTHLRSDRDRYISVDDSDWPCASTNANFYFDNWWKCGAGDRGQGYGPFDFAAAPAQPTTRSVMMYVTSDYSRRSDNQTMVGLNPPLTGPEENDGTAIIELYGPVAWRKSYPRGRDVGATQPLDDSVAQGVSIQGAPAIAHTSCANMDIYVRGSNNRLYHRIVANDSWTTNNGNSLYADLSTLTLPAIDSDPAAVDAPDGSSKLVAARSVRNIFVRRYAGNAWGAWQPLTGPTGLGTACSAPALAQDRTEARLFVVACNGSLYERRRPNADDADWGAWTRVAGAPPNDPFVERPAVTASKAGQFELFVTVASGRLWNLTSVNGTWGSWVQRGSGAATTAPAVAGSIYGDAGGRVGVFYRTLPAPYARLMWSEILSNGSWTAPIPISGQYANIAADMCSVIRMDLVGVMHDGFNVQRGLWHKNYWNP